MHNAVIVKLNCCLVHIPAKYLSRALEQSSTILATHSREWLIWILRHSDMHATGHIPEAQCAFKSLMIHEVLQFALRIAFRCVLHRCGSLDIHC